VDAERDLERGLLTARGLDRVLRVSWTIADLAGRDRPGRADVLTGLALRTGVQRGRSLMDRPLTHPVDSNLDLGSES
jgi:magnesium chelatase family protein